MNRKLLTALSLAAIAAPAVAEAGVPTFVPLQGFLSDADGDPVDGNRDVSFTLYADESGGSPLYSETHNHLSVEGGAFFAYLGHGASDSSLTSDLAADHGALWVEITIDGIETIEPRFAMGSVPFALVSDQCATASRAESASHADSATTAAEAAHAVACDSATDAVHAATAINAELLDGQDSSAYTYFAGSGIDVIDNAISVRPSGVTGEMLAGDLTYSGDLTIAGETALSPDSDEAALRVRVGSEQLSFDASEISTTSDSLEINRTNPNSAMVVHGPLVAAKSVWVAGHVQAGHKLTLCQNTNDCTCPSGTNLLSGGASATTGYALTESRPSNATQWTARDTSPNEVPRSITILCARIAADPAF